MTCEDVYAGYLSESPASHNLDREGRAAGPEKKKLKSNLGIWVVGSAAVAAPVCEDDVGVHGRHIQVVDQGALLPVGHIPQGLQLPLDLIPYFLIVGNIFHRRLALYCDGIPQVFVQLVYQGL